MQGGGDGCGEVVQVLVEGGRVLRRLAGSGGQGSLTAEPGPAAGALPVRRQRAAPSYWEGHQSVFRGGDQGRLPCPPRPPPPVPSPSSTPAPWCPSQGSWFQKTHQLRVCGEKHVTLEGYQMHTERTGCEAHGAASVGGGGAVQRKDVLFGGAFARPVVWKMDLLGWSSDFILFSLLRSLSLSFCLFFS